MNNLIDFLLRVLYLSFSKAGGDPQADEKRRRRRNIISNALFAGVCFAVFACLVTGIVFLIVGGNLRVAGIVLVSVASGVFVLSCVFIAAAIGVGLKKLKKMNAEPERDNVIDID